MDPEGDAARAGIARFRLVAQSEVAQQPGAQRAVNRAIALGALGVDRRSRPVQLVERPCQLRVDVAPFAHARHREEVLARLLLELVLEELRQLEEAEEVRAL